MGNADIFRKSIKWAIGIEALLMIVTFLATVFAGHFGLAVFLGLHFPTSFLSASLVDSGILSGLVGALVSIIGQGLLVTLVVFCMLKRISKVW